MIARRGTGYYNYTRDDVYKVQISTGLNPKGKPREPVATMTVFAFKKLTGIALQKGETVEIDLKTKTVVHNPEPVLTLDNILKVKGKKTRRCKHCGNIT